MRARAEFGREGRPSLTPRTWSRQSGALSLVGRVEIVLSLVESFIELKYFHDVATPALLCHKELAQGTQRPLPGDLGGNSLSIWGVLYGIRAPLIDSLCA